MNKLNSEFNLNLKLVARIGVLAGLYAVITVILAPFSYGPVQVRVSEALTLLPFFFGSYAAVALWLGCMIANIFGGFGLVDIIFGALLTLIAGLLTARARSMLEAGIYPVVINALGVAAILHFTAGFPYFSTAFYVGVGEAIAVYAIGFPLSRLINERLHDFF